VDKNGNVVYASAGAKGTTINRSRLVAKNAKMQSKTPN